MLTEVVEKYHFSGAQPAFFDCPSDWPDGDLSPWLDPAYLHDVNSRYFELADEPFSILLGAAQELLKRPDLNRFGRYCRWLLFESGYDAEYLAHLGFPKPVTGVQALDDFFGLLVHLSGVETVEKRYAARGIPLRHLRDSYSSVRIWVDAFRRYYGRWGHNRDGARMVNIEHLRNIRIGRLEFEICWFYGKIIVLRSRTTGVALALSEGGVRVNTQGRVSGANDIWDPHAWVSFFNETEDSWIGHAVSGCRILPEMARYPKAEWEEVVHRGQCSLNIHIPRDGRMTKAEIERTMEEADAFFRRYFPDHPFRIFECHTWLFDPQLEDMLGEDSGIAQFARLFYRFPEQATDRGAMVFGFTEAPFDMKAWQPTTRLQQKIKDHYAQGGRMCAAGGFILPGGSVPPKTHI